VHRTAFLFHILKGKGGGKPMDKPERKRPAYAFYDPNTPEILEKKLEEILERRIRAKQSEPDRSIDYTEPT
jgi:hypothetical protein